MIGIQIIQFWLIFVWYWGFPDSSAIKETAFNAGDRRCEFPSLGQEDPLEEEIATHSSVLAWKIPRMEESDELQSKGLQRAGHDRAQHHSFIVCIDIS